MSELKELQELVNELNSTNSNNDKLAILAQYPQCKNILLYTYNSFWKFGVTSANCKKNSHILSSGMNDSRGYPIPCHPDIFSLLEDLKDRKLTGHDAIGAVNSFVEANKEFEGLIWLIIDRNLKTRTDEKAINKVWKDLVPTFNVALANKYDDKTAKKVTWDGTYLGSRKLDGIRVVTIINSDDDIKFFSRAGNEFVTLDNVRKALQKKTFISPTVLDGELCITDDMGNEDFKAAVSQIKRKDFTIEKPRYKLFDVLPLETFLAKKGTVKLSTRLESLNYLIGDDDPVLSVLEQTPMTEETFEQLQADVVKGGWEGCMLRLNAPYKGKRSNDLLKVKKFFDDEFVVEDVEFGKKPMMNADGLMEEKDTLAAVHITYKGNDVRVGSGFSDIQRICYYNKPEEIIGKTITVQYFEECCDKDGKVSLRFPTLKHIYEEGRDV